MKQIKIFSPASVSNVCCGFDVLGFSVDGIGDELTISKSKKNKITITKTSGFTVPSENNKNTERVSKIFFNIKSLYILFFIKKQYLNKIL